MTHNKNGKNVKKKEEKLICYVRYNGKMKEKK